MAARTRLTAATETSTVTSYSPVRFAMSAPPLAQADEGHREDSGAVPGGLEGGNRMGVRSVERERELGRGLIVRSARAHREPASRRPRPVHRCAAAVAEQVVAAAGP